MQNFEQQAIPELDYKALKEQFLSNGLTLRELRLQLLDADQATQMHEAAYNNLAFLEDVEVKESILNQSEEIQKSYFNFLGFTQWHVAQNFILEGKNQEAIELFRQSVESSIKGENDESWIAYGKGTIAYLERDINNLKQNITAVTTSEKNKAILERMLKGLEERGGVDYLVDYSGQK